MKMFFKNYPKFISTLAWFIILVSLRCLGVINSEWFLWILCLLLVIDVFLLESELARRKGNLRTKSESDENQNKQKSSEVSQHL